MDSSKLDRLLRDLPVAMIVLREEDLLIDYSSPLVRQVVGCERMVPGVPIADALPELEEQGILAFVQEVATTGRPVHVDSAAMEVHRGGARERLIFTWNVVPLLDDQRRVEGVVAVGIDVTQLVTEQRRAELTAAELDTLLEQCPLGVGVWDADLRYTRVNPALAAMNGLSPAEHLGRTIDEIVPGAANDLGDALRDASIGGAPVRRVITCQQPGRTEALSVHVTGYPVRRRGRVTSVGAICEDVTEDLRIEQERRALRERQRETAEQLAASEREFRALAESIPQIVWRADPDGTPTWVNRQWRRYAGVEVTTLDTDAWVALIHAGDRREALARWEQSIASGDGYEIEYRLRRLDGTYRWFLVRALPYDGDGDEIAGWFGTCTDIDDQRRAVEERERLITAERAARAQAEESERRARLLGDSIRASEERLRMAIEAAEVGTWDLDPATGAMTLDARTKELLGVPGSAVVVWDTWVASLHPGDRDRVRQAMERMRIPEHDALDEQFRVVGLVDGAERHLRVRGRMYFREACPLRLVGTVRDVTADVDAREEVERHAHFRELFLGVLGHDLRNPIGAIRMTSQMLLRQPELPGTAEPLVRRIVVTADRMMRMIRQLLDMTRVRLAGGIVLSVREAELGEICRRVVDEVLCAEPEAVVELSCAGDLTGVWDPDRLEQVVANLIANAVAHGKGPVHVDGFSADGRVCLRVHNDGPPIAPELLPGLFDPFTRSSTNAVPGVGLGLGLYISQHIAQAHGGEVTVRSSEKEGTIFTVSLPRKASGQTSSA